MESTLTERQRATRPVFGGVIATLARGTGRQRAIEQAWLGVAPGSGALALRAGILAEREQNGLAAARFPRGFQLLAAQFAEPAPAIGAAVEHEHIRAHDAALRLRSRCSGLIASSLPLFSCLICAAISSRAKRSGVNPGSSSPPMAMKLR